MLKLIKSRNRYENSTKTNVVTLGKGLSAVSYNWWTYLKVVDGHIVFNQYKYSLTTQKHQRECLRLLESRGIKIDRFVNQVESL